MQDLVVGVFIRVVVKVHHNFTDLSVEGTPNVSELVACLVLVVVG